MSLPDVRARGKDFLDLGGLRKKRYWKLFSMATLFATGSFAKLIMNVPLKHETQNMDILLEAHKRSKLENRGLVTVMNHSSLLDDPFTWGILPFKFFLSPANIRWSLGADNVCFGTVPLKIFFSLGQVLSTTRFGRGPFQGSLDAAIYLLSNPADEYQVTSVPRVPTDTIAHSNWVHIFPEAFVHQVYPPHENSMRYFHWGISRLLLESSRPPIVVPMFSHGFDKVIPEDKDADYSIFKKVGTQVQFRIGNPVDESLISDYRSQWQALVQKEHLTSNSVCNDLTENLKTGKEAQDLRSRLAFAMRDQVSQVRMSMGLPSQDDRFGFPEFWKPDGGCVDVPVMGNVNKLPQHK